eukprot:TRINITY_DN122505_c0_g1_i1.p1 TRINITY_DN122505_c0_g1~~TRINITY_DN122505_c0_g1_i1.p1  ORF type:complete len:158 (+),score=31.25 TRINITY_DN122505_c0_g1_i1:47-475(+)
MAHGLSHLHSAWAVEKAVTEEESKVVLLRFGYDYDPACMETDELLVAASKQVETICEMHLVDIKEVPDFTSQYELYDPCTLMFFYRGRHVQLELGLGDRFKINWPIGNVRDLVNVVEAVHRGAQQGRDLIVAAKDHSLAYRT